MYRSPLTRQVKITANSQHHINRTPPARPAIDLVYADGNNTNQPVVAITDGIIQFAFVYNAPGTKDHGEKIVGLRTGKGEIVQYNHLDKILVKPGQRVKTGDILGIMGNTGNSQGIHLHLEIWTQGTPESAIDPEPFLELDQINKSNNTTNMSAQTHIKSIADKAFDEAKSWERFKELAQDEQRAVDSSFSIIYLLARILGLRKDIQTEQDKLSKAKSRINVLEAENQRLKLEILSKDNQIAFLNNEIENITSQPVYIPPEEEPKASEVKPSQKTGYKTPLSTIITNDTLSKVFEGFAHGGGVITVASVILPLLIPDLEQEAVVTMLGALTTLLSGLGIGATNAEKIKRKRLENESTK